MKLLRNLLDVSLQLKRNFKLEVLKGYFVLISLLLNIREQERFHCNMNSMQNHLMH